MEKNIDNLENELEPYYSQDGQDKFLDTIVFKGFKNGFFVDVGAHDGISYNNTLYFEKNLGWKGINIEPLQKVYEKLVVNRPDSINVNCAICKHNGTAEFISNTGYTEMLSGLKGTYDPRHHKRLNTEISIAGGTSDIIMVQTRTLEYVFDNLNINRVNYLSIDVEGAEEDVIKSINFDKVFIDIIGFENNYKNNSQYLINYLSNKGFIYIQQTQPGEKEKFDIFMLHKDSEFYPK